MNINKNTSTRSGFTLIELLTVIAIIGILAGILIPAVGLVRTAANKTASVSNMRSIATAFATWSTPNSRVKVLTAAMLGASPTTNSVSEFLADKAGLVESEMWLVTSSDAYANYVASTAIPPLIGTRAAGTNAFVTDTGWTSGVPIAYNFAIAIPGNRSTSLTPLLWTTGLSPSAGTWDPAGTPWETGGHICYLDTHVSYYEDLDVASPNGEYLVDPATNTLTVVMTDVHPVANILVPATPAP